MKIKPDEIEIRGMWDYVGGKITPDTTCRRIDLLTKTYLTIIGSDSSGWDVLYQDPNDNRYWELLYLESELHGGGPPTLRMLEESKAKKKYNLKSRKTKEH